MPDTPRPSAVELLQERERLLREKEQLTAELRVMQLKVEKLQRQLWGRKSEQMPATDTNQGVLFEEPATKSVAATERAASNRQPRSEHVAKGPKPLDPALPREVIPVPAPDLKDLRAARSRGPPGGPGSACPGRCGGGWG